MTIDSAIAHSEEVAATTKCKECAEEHRQLAEWLKELKAYREREQKAIRKRCPMV